MARTYFHSPTDQANPAHNAAIEKLADVVPPAGSFDFTISGIGTNGTIAASFTTAPNEPNSAAWPTGDYLVELDVPAMDSTTTFGLLTQGTAPGHLARVNGTLDADIEAFEQAQPAFSTPGLKSISFPAQTWAPGSQTDRVEALVAAVKVFGHGNDSIVIRCDGDGLISGPWGGGGIQPTGVRLVDVELVDLQAADVEIASALTLDAEIG